MKDIKYYFTTSKYAPLVWVGTFVLLMLAFGGLTIDIHLGWTN